MGDTRLDQLVKCWGSCDKLNDSESEQLIGLLLAERESLQSSLAHLENLFDERDNKLLSLDNECHGLQSQLSEARAHCERLRDGLINICEYWNGDSGFAAVDAIEQVMVIGHELLEETPAQSFAEIKAQAILEACRESMPGPCNPPDDPPPGYNEFCEGVATVADYAARLRQQGKEPTPT